MDDQESIIFKLNESSNIPDCVHDDYMETFGNTRTPIVIDNGSYQCRVGWASANQSEPVFVFKNLIAKPRKERGKKEGELQVGNDIINIEAVRFHLRTQFDRDVVTHFEAQEQVLDHIFSHLGIDIAGSVDHPIVMTETFLNPSHSRNLMSELMFEYYSIPSAVYGVDALFSWSRESEMAVKRDSLVLRLGQHCVHVLPILNGKVIAEHARRINIGGIHITSFFHRLMQLKNPMLASSISVSQAEELLFKRGRISENLTEEIALWESLDYQAKNLLLVELPFSVSSSVPVTSDLTLEQQQLRRKELARRLGEMNARKREQRLAEDEEALSNMVGVQEMLEDGDSEEFQKALEELDLSNSIELSKAIRNLRSKIKKTKAKILAAANVNSEDVPKVVPQNEVKVYKLLQEYPIPINSDEMDPWIVELKQKRQVILNKRNARRQKRQDMAKRRTAAAQERMRIISQLAKKDKRDDTFGMKDEDWDVYKTIQKDGGDSDSEEEVEQLAELEELLQRYAPNITCPLEKPKMPLFMCSPEKYQFPLGIELMRAPELLFQPSIIGHEQAGLSETIEHVLKIFNTDEQNRLVNDIYITGGSSRFPGLVPRLTREVMTMRPFGSSFNIRLSNDPSLSTWHGARQLALDKDWIESNCITKSYFEECGGDYLSSHISSNPYWPKHNSFDTKEKMDVDF